MSRKIVIETKNGNHVMEKETFIRWLCLVEMVQLTEEKARELNVDLDKYDWIKPIAIKKYMTEKFKNMEIDLQAVEKNKTLKLKYINNTRHTAKCHSPTYQKQNVLTQNRHRRGRKKHAELELS
jgi:hypothetical protein